MDPREYVDYKLFENRDIHVKICFKTNTCIYDSRINKSM